ncbi:hypothetical protein MPER_04735, partial [Moniliophthora perniciosa FA553]
ATVSGGADASDCAHPGMTPSAAPSKVCLGNESWPTLLGGRVDAGVSLLREDSLSELRAPL